MLFGEKCKALVIASIFLFGNVFCSDYCKEEQRDFVRKTGKVEDYLGDINTLFIKMACACFISIEEVDNKKECAFEFEVKYPDNTDSVFDISIIGKVLFIREVEPLSSVYQEIQKTNGLIFIEEMRPSSCWDSININENVFYFLKPKVLSNNQSPSIVSIILKVMRGARGLYGQFDSALEIKNDLSMYFYIKAASISIPEESSLMGVDSDDEKKSTIEVETLRLPDSSTTNNIEIIYKNPLVLSAS